MTQENASGNAVTERLRTSEIAVGDSSPVEAMLANSLRERKPLADDGALHDSVQEAENAASSFVFVPPGTFNESITIDTVGLTLIGTGRATHITDSTSSNTINTSASNVTIENISASNNGGSVCIQTDIQNTLKNVTVRTSTGYGISTNTDCIVSNCTIEDFGTDGTFARGISTGTRTVVSGCRVTENSGGSGSEAIGVGADDGICVNNILTTSAEKNIGVIASDCIILGNIAFGAKDDDIRINSSSDNIVANNRAGNINDLAANTTLDANLTGSSN